MTARWPLIQEAVSEGYLSFADMVFAERLLRSCLSITEETAAFLCHMTLAAREGHLCVLVEKDSIIPNPFSLWSKREKTLSDALKELLNKLSLGAASLPSFLISSMSSLSPNEQYFPRTPLCEWNSRYYLQKNWLYETYFLTYLKKLLKTPPQRKIDFKDVSDQIAMLQQQKVLNSVQAEAILQASQASIFAISGGPGTGKTYTAAQLIRLFLKLSTNDKEAPQYFAEKQDASEDRNIEAKPTPSKINSSSYLYMPPPSKKEEYRIAVTAPTGKAVAHLQNQLAKIEETKIEMKTIHALLGIRSDLKSAPECILRMPYDLVIVDECSMIDVKLMGMLLASIKPGARLILLGDPYQLPSIEAGSLFADLIQTLSPSHRIELNIGLRTNNNDLKAFAEAVKNGENPKKNFFINGWHSFLDKVEERFISLQKGKTFEELLDAFQQFRLLSPLRKGPYGVEEINVKLYERLSRRAIHTSFFAMPIMIAKNDYERELFNGEVGVFIQESGKESAYALFSGREGLRKIPALLLPPFEYGYCLSVHKSQGSEFDSVFLLLPEGGEKFGREILYTAATRARSELLIWGEWHIFEEVLKKTTQRLSGVVERGKPRQEPF